MASAINIGTSWSGLAPSTGPYFTGSPAYASALATADVHLLELIYGAHPNACFAINDSTASTTYNMYILAPAYATKCQVGIIAAGAGTVTINGSYAIDVTGDTGATEIAEAALLWGSESTLLGVSNTNTGLPAIQTYSLASPSGVKVYSLVFVWTRVTTAL